MSSRIYLVQTKGKSGIEDTVLVDAQTKSQALRFVAERTFEAKAASSREVANYIKQGAKLYDAVEQKELNANGTNHAAHANADQTAQLSGS